MKDKKIPLLERDRLLLALRRLNMIVPSQLPILSLYLTAGSSRHSTKKALQFIDKETEKIYDKVKEEGFNPNPLKEDIKRIKEFIEFNTDEGTEGLAAFVSGYRDIFLTYPINFPFKNQIILDKDVYRIPLVYLLSEQPREIFIFLYPDKAEIYRYTDGRLQEKEPPAMPRKKGMPLKSYMRSVKDEYWPYFRSDDVRDVFLLGDKDAMNMFVKILAKTAVQKIKEKIEVPKRATKKRLENEAEKLIKKYNIINPKEKVGQAKSLAQRKMAVFGPEAVLQALREGKVKEIIVDRSFNPKGWRCIRCNLLSLKGDACSFCGGQTEKIKHLKQAIVRDANNYEVQTIRVSNEFLRKNGNGIAAILRFF